jgi:hypothetical protein
VDPIAEYAIEQVGSAVLEEAVDEATGRSNKKWALVLVAFAVGGIIGAIIVKRRRDRPSTELEPQ